MTKLKNAGLWRSSFPNSQRGNKMTARSPEEIYRLFQKYMAEGDLDMVLSVYDAEAVFLNKSGEVKKGEALKQELAQFAAVKAIFDFNIKQVIQSGDIALVHTEWKVSAPQPYPCMRSRLLAASQTVAGAGSSVTPLRSEGRRSPESNEIAAELWMM